MRAASGRRPELSPEALSTAWPVAATREGRAGRGIWNLADRRRGALSTVDGRLVEGRGRLRPEGPAEEG